jgi:hypothetical protein
MTFQHYFKHERKRDGFVFIPLSFIPASKARLTWLEVVKMRNSEAGLER